MQLTHYLRALRRMWPIIVGLCLLGAVGGWLATPAPAQAPDEHYYRATHTLIAQQDEGSAPSQSNLDQAAFLVGTDNIIDRVAEELALDEKVVGNSIMGEAFPTLLTIEVTAIAHDAGEAVLLADTAAAQLLEYLLDEATVQNTSQRDRVLRQVDDLQLQLDLLDLELAGLPAGVSNDPLQADRDSVYNQYRLARDLQASLAAQGPPTAGFIGLETAAPIEISREAFDARRKRVKAGFQPQGPITAAAAPPDVESPPAPPNAKLSIIAGGLAGFLVGVAIALMIDRYDTRLRTKVDAEKAFGLPVIAEIPPFTSAQRSHTEILAFNQPRSRITEAYRVIRTSILFVEAARRPSDGDGNGNGNGNGRAGGVVESQDRKSRVILVTSPGPDDGKTTTVANLAAVLAESGLTVLVVNCDFRRPKLHRYLEPLMVTETSSGENALPSNVEPTAEDVHDSKEVRIVRTVVPGVRMVTGLSEGDHDANPADVIAKQLRVVEFARQRFDVVLLDTAPLLTTNDAAELLVEADLVVLVAHCGKTRWEAAERSSELLARLDARVLGVALTNSSDSPSGQYYYYYLDPSGDVRDDTRKSRDQVKVRKRLTEAEPA